MNFVTSFFRTLNSELGEIASHMDTAGWITLSAVSVVLGYLFLRGNIIRST